MRDERAFLWDMLDAAQHVSRYVAGKTFAHFETDEMIQDAVIRQLSIVGEAARQISPATRATLPMLRFDLMVRMRNVMTHVYWDVRLDVVWDTATNDIPALITALEPLFPPDMPL